MKKFNKVLLSISGICAAAGVVLILAGLLTGVSKNEILSSLSVTSADFGKHVEKMVTSGMEDTWKGDWDDPDMSQWQMKQYSDINKLDIHIGLGQLELQEYDGDSVQVFVTKDDKGTELKSDGGKLKIRQKDHMHIFDENGNRPLKVMVPKGKIFEKVDIEIGAGEGIINSLKTDEISVNVGAGSLEVIQTVQAKKSDWSVGAGSLYLNRLISSKTNLKCAVGEITATLDGTEEDYHMTGNVGVGSLMFAGSECGDSIGQKINFGKDSAKNKVTVDCGTGEINVDFTE